MVDRESLKERVFAAVDAAEPMVRAYAEDIAANAELGFSKRAPAPNWPGISNRWD